MSSRVRSADATQAGSVTIWRSGYSEGAAKSEGIALGEQVAAAVQADRAADGTNVPRLQRNEKCGRPQEHHPHLRTDERRHVLDPDQHRSGVAGRASVRDCQVTLPRR